MQKAGNTGYYLAFIKYILFQRIPKHVVKLNGIFKRKFYIRTKYAGEGTNQIKKIYCPTEITVFLFKTFLILKRRFPYRYESLYKRMEGKCAS